MFLKTSRMEVFLSLNFSWLFTRHIQLINSCFYCNHSMLFDRQHLLIIKELFVFIIFCIKPLLTYSNGDRCMQLAIQLNINTPRIDDSDLLYYSYNGQMKAAFDPRKLRANYIYVL